MKLFFQLTLLLTTFVGAQSRSHTQRSPIAFTHVAVIDTASLSVQPDITVVISRDHIAHVGKASQIMVPKDAQLIDGRGKFLMPGLWDMHVHTLAPERRDTYFPLFVANGVTGVRDTGAWISFPEIQRWRQQLASGELVGPRLLAVAGPLVDGPGAKHIRTGGAPNDFGALTVSNAAEARAAVRSLQQQGADFIKVYNQLPREAFFAIADEARLRGISFAGHVPFSVTMAEASSAGQRSMEHLDAALLECAKSL
jgi:hypothetical protein